MEAWTAEVNTFISGKCTLSGLSTTAIQLICSSTELYDTATINTQERAKKADKL